jgi:hypothetical protein
MAQTSEEDKQRPKADTYADFVERKCWHPCLHPTQEGPRIVSIKGDTLRRKDPHIVRRMQPSGGPHTTAYGSAVRSAPPGPVPGALRVHRPTGAACLQGPTLHRMRNLASLETPKFGGGGRRHPNPRSRYGARPRPAAERPDPICLWPSIETAYRLRRLSMQEAASLCGTTRCGGRRSAPGGFVGRFRSVERGYAVSCKRASEDSPSRSVAWLNKLACKGPQAAVPSGRAGASSDSPEDAL